MTEERGSLLDEMLEGVTPEKAQAEIDSLEVRLRDAVERESAASRDRARFEARLELMRSIRSLVGGEARDAGKSLSDREQEPAGPSAAEPDASSKRPLILEIMRGTGREGGRTAWTAMELRDELDRRGAPITPNNARQTLRRMVAKGQLARAEDGQRFRLP